MSRLCHPPVVSLTAADPQSPNRVGQVVKWVQTSAILEVVHAATGLVYVHTHLFGFV